MLHRRKSSAGIVYYSSPLLEEIAVPHAFSTRIGGVSPAPFSSLNLGNPSGVGVQDEWERIYENWRMFQRIAGCGARERCWVHQVHGGDVMQISPQEKARSGNKADAIVTNDPATAATVRVADCVPVLLANEDGSVVAAIHCGWRGVIAAVVPHAAMTLKCPAPKVVAAIGPCIGVESFEVGPEVVGQFEIAFNGDVPVRRTVGGKGLVDLRTSIHCQLKRLGVERIDSTDRCTFRDADEFFSDRRDRGATGRMAAIIGPKPYPWLR